MPAESCPSFPGQNRSYGLGPSLPAFDEHGPCGQCGEAVMSDDSFCKLRGTETYVHINNARPSCLDAYDGQLAHAVDR